MLFEACKKYIDSKLLFKIHHIVLRVIYFTVHLAVVRNKCTQLIIEFLFIFDKGIISKILQYCT
jgi:hypothetical protein